MTRPAEIEQKAGEAFRALQAKAKAEHGGNTQPLLVVYAVESFLRRLSISACADQMVLKGGMLMAASQIRQMTKDADLSTHGVANDEERVRRVVAQICALEPDPHDGVVIDEATIKTEVMREQDEYQGVRCKLVANLGQAGSTSPWTSPSATPVNPSRSSWIRSSIKLPYDWRRTPSPSIWRRRSSPRCSDARPAPETVTSPTSGSPAAGTASRGRSCARTSSGSPRIAVSP